MWQKFQCQNPHKSSENYRKWRCWPQEENKPKSCSIGVIVVIKHQYQKIKCTSLDLGRNSKIPGNWQKFQHEYHQNVVRNFGLMKIKCIYHPLGGNSVHVIRIFYLNDGKWFMVSPPPSPWFWGHNFWNAIFHGGFWRKWGTSYIWGTYISYIWGTYKMVLLLGVPFQVIDHITFTNCYLSF